jgi:hypothetical protein
MELSHEWPEGLTEAARQRVRDQLDAGCQCSATAARLVQRRIAGDAITIYVQCAGCGASLGGPHKRDQHPDWAAYPLWSDEQRDAYWAEQVAQREAEQAAWLAARPERQADYAGFLETSEWRRLRRLVFARANYRCEACLVNGAVEVHHRTYEFGWLPPAFCLVAVCGPCHARLHTGWKDPA